MTRNYIEEIDLLWQRQLTEWDAVIKNYGNLANVTTRVVELGDSSIVLQYNPERLRSSAANIDAASLKARPCFLCNENQPHEQESVVWNGSYKIQVNPYPIFTRHLTISATEHTPQCIAGRLTDMMLLAKDLLDYVVFYNGPVSGASAPDHMHFQAGIIYELPICDELFNASTALFDANNQGIFGVITDLGRPVFYIETMNTDLGELWLNSLLDVLPVKNGHIEPMVNILCWHNSGSWCIAVFPRRKHRPACYGTGEDQFVISPASLDMGGLWAIAREEDYNNLTLHDVRLIYQDVCLSPEDVEDVSNKLRQYYYSKKNNTLWHKFPK